MRLTRFGAGEAVAIVVAAVGLSAACANTSGDTAKDLPNATPAQFCAAYGGYAQKCNETDSCTTGLVQSCPAFDVSFSAAYRTAFTSCAASEATCLGQLASGGIGSLLTTDASKDTCLAAQESAFAPTATQQKYAQDYCAACGSVANLPAGAACAQSFYAIPDGGSTIDVLAVVAFDFNDDLVTAFDTQCVLPLGTDNLSPQSCGTDFYQCVNNVVAKAIPPPAACLGETPDAGASDGG